MVILYTAKTSVGWWKNFSLNILLISGGSSSILLSLVWREFYYIMETSSLQYLHLLQSTWKKPIAAFKICWEKSVRRALVKHMCKPESCGITARRLNEILLFSVSVGKPSEGQALPYKAMATTRRKNSRWEECSTSSFNRKDENIFTPTQHKTWIN